jgi:glucokinase
MILVGDVGGTRTRLALAEREGAGWRITAVEESRTGPDILQAVAGYARSAGGGRVVSAAFSGAGAPAADGSIRLTNADVRLDALELARAAGVAHALLVNDFRAIAAPASAPPSVPGAPAGGTRSRATAGTRTSLPWTTRSSRPGSGCAVRTGACRRNRC